MAIADGLYELRSILSTSMCVAVVSSSSVAGANIVLYSETGSNGQKWQITEVTTNKWSLVSGASGQYMAVNTAKATNGANVFQYTSTGSNGQRWLIADTGTDVTIDGVSCDVVTIQSYASADGGTYYLDVDKALASNSSNMEINSAAGDSQKFALLPTTLMDYSMPVPMGLGWSEAVGESGQLSLPGAAKLYPTWTFTDAWSDLSSHGFEYSYRTRSLADDSATPGAWGSWSAWTAASVTTKGNVAWLTAGLTATVASGNKSMDVNIRVRPTATVGGVSYHGSTSSAILTALFVPTVSVTSVALGPDALELAITSDYGGGSTVLEVTSITNSTGKEYLSGKVAFSGVGSPLSVEVPLSLLHDVPNPSEVSTLNVAMRVGTDQFAPRDSQASTSVTYGWSTKKTLSLSPTLDWSTVPATALVPISVGDTKRGWLFAGGEAHTLHVTSAGKAVLPYPFGAACTYYVSGEKSDETAFGGYVGSITATDSHKAKPCHAWNWQDKALVLSVNAGAMQTSRSVKATASVMQLDERPWQTVTFAETMQGDIKAQGALLPGGTSTSADVVALAKAHHATYRAPSGEVIEAAIDSVQYASTASVTNVDVSMVQEAR